jgi:hypothetical protein
LGGDLQIALHVEGAAASKIVGQRPPFLGQETAHTPFGPARNPAALNLNNHELSPE